MLPFEHTKEENEEPCVGNGHTEQQVFRVYDELDPHRDSDAHVARDQKKKRYSDSEVHETRVNA